MDGQTDAPGAFPLLIEHLEISSPLFLDLEKGERESRLFFFYNFTDLSRETERNVPTVIPNNQDGGTLKTP